MDYSQISKKFSFNTDEEQFILVNLCLAEKKETEPPTL